jgi:Asp-tRNA(Asn)/Glu-tRNA(Gln) amidotransferase A subunit family amidase
VIDATELALRIRRREISPVEALAEHRDRTERLNPRLNAIVTEAADAEERAREAEAAVQRGDELGPLHGVPFTVKDTFDTAGVRTTRGSRLFAEHMPQRDATVVARARAAGGIFLGKTNTPEFALWWETANLVFGRTSNPHDPERSSGGSSGGEAVAVATGMSSVGIGSDLGGSIRLPSHYCGVVGFKPTHGRVPLTGHFPETLFRFTHAGPVARSVRDAAVALAVLEGPDGEDWYAAPLPRPTFEVAPPRIGWTHTAFGAVEDAIAAAVEEAARALADSGPIVERAEPEGLAALDANELTLRLYAAESRAYFELLVGERRSELHPAMRRRLDLPAATLDEYVAAEAAVERLRRDLAAFFRRYDVLLCPTAPVVAPPHDAEEIRIGGAAFAPRTSMRATIPFDLTGSPALTVPFSRSPEGLPVGVQLVGRRFEDETVLRAGAVVERAASPGEAE